MKKLLLLSLLLALPIIASAYDALVDGIYYNLIPKGNVAEVTSGDTKYSGSVTIPEKFTYEGMEYSVTSIGNNAFNGCTGLTSVTIGNSVTSIGSGAFSGCSGLTSLTIPNSVTTIGSSAFSGCSGLTSVIIPNSVTSIGGWAFDGCSGLTSLVISDLAAWLNVSLGNDSSNPLKNSNAHHLFLNDNEITDLVIPNSVTNIKKYAFEGCSSLTSVTIPNSVTTIGERAFYGCSGLTSVTIGNSVTSIGEGAFAYCSSLTSVTIPNSVTSIGYAAFDVCSGLTSVTIPNSVTSIGNIAFALCSGLTEIYSRITEPFEINTNCWYNVNKDIPLYVPAGTKAKYEATAGWSEFTNIVEMDIAPVDDGQNVDFSNDIDETTNLDGNIVGDIFYSISSGDGSYNAAEGCLVVTKPTNDSDIDGKDIFGEDFKDNYTGIVFKVKPGKGTVNVMAETQGNMVMKVKIGDSEPLVLDFEGKMKMSFPYNVSEASLVYIYGGMSSAGAKATGGTRSSADEDLLKIYGFEVVSDQTGIETIDVGESSTPDAIVYNLNGQRVNKAGKGVFIKNGRKILVK